MKIAIKRLNMNVIDVELPNGYKAKIVEKVKTMIKKSGIIKCMRKISLSSLV